MAGLVSAAKFNSKTKLETLSFVNHNGDTFSLNDLNGKPVILSYVFTGCSVYCPVQVGSLKVLQERLNKQLGIDSYQLLSVTLTPEKDSPADMKQYAARFSADLNNWQFATGTDANVDALIKATKAKVIKWGDEYELDHTTFVYLINADGALSYQFDGIPLDKESLENALKKEISKNS